MNILFSTPTSKAYINCPKIVENQIVCGPGWEFEKNENEYLSVKTPGGMYDLKESISMVPDIWKPDMVVVWADASMTNVPRNLNKFNCPRVLIVGDTHHLVNPLYKMITYAKMEPFDIVITINNRHHAHFFVEAGIKNMYWLPGFGAQIFSLPFCKERQNQFVFVGQVGQFHPRRRRLIPQLQEANLPLKVGQLPANLAAKAYASNLGSFHCSLNGDMSFRNFEVLSVGGFLLGDYLSKQSGMHLLFEENKHWVSYKNFDELCQKIKYFLLHPDEALAIAHNGYQEFWRNHSPEKKKKEFLDIILNKKVNPLYEISAEKRINCFFVSNLPALKSQRLAVYELIQEIHRELEEVQTICTSEVDGQVICDIADLPRVKLMVIESDDKENKKHMFKENGIEDSIQWGSWQDAYGKTFEVGIFKACEIKRGIVTNVKYLVAIDGEMVDEELSVILKAKGYCNVDGYSNIFKNINLQEKVAPKLPLVTIGMPVYNGARYVAKTIHSLLNQTFKDFQIIICDDQSTDETVAICKAFAQQDSRIQVNINETRLGGAKNFNRVFELSQGKYFMWASQDDIFHPTYVEKCLAKLEANPNAVLALTEISFIDEFGRPAVAESPNDRNIGTEGMNVVERLHEVFIRTGWWAIYGLIRPEILRKTQLYRATFGGDVILIVELLLHGEFAKVPEPLFIYRGRTQMPFTIRHNMQSIDHTQESSQTAYTNLMQEIVQCVLKTDLNPAIKHAIIVDLSRTLMTQNIPIGRNIINENLMHFLALAVSADDLHGLIGDYIQRKCNE